MAKSSQGLRARMSQRTGQSRQQPADPGQRIFDDLKHMLSETGGPLVSRSGQRKGAAKQASSEKTLAARRRSGQQRQAAARKVAANRIRSAQQRQAATKQAARSRRTKKS